MELACKGVLGTRAGAHHGASSSSAAAVALSTTSLLKILSLKLLKLSLASLSSDEIKELNQDKSYLLRNSLWIFFIIY